MANANASAQEYLVNTLPHPRNGSFRIVVRDLKHPQVNVHQIQGTQMMRPQLLQVLQNGHLVIGYSLVRPFHFDFLDDEGNLYNKIETDADRCWILKSGLLVEVQGKQTVVKQVMPEFKMSRIVRVYDLTAQWVDELQPGKLVASVRVDTGSSGSSLLHILDLGTSIIEQMLPIQLQNLQLKDHCLYGVTPQGDFVERMHLDNLLTDGFLRIEVTPVMIRRQKINRTRLFLINDRYTLYENQQKQHVRDIGSVSHFLVDWTKHQTIWNSTQDIQVIATSKGGYFVYYDIDAATYFFIVCGSSISTPIHALKGLKPKGESRFMSDGMFVFHSERRVMIVDLESGAVRAQFEEKRYLCDLMILSKSDYKQKPVPMEIVKDTPEDALHVEEIQKLVETKETKEEKEEIKNVKPEPKKVEIKQEHVVEIPIVETKPTAEKMEEVVIASTVIPSTVIPSTAIPSDSSSQATVASSYCSIM